MLRVFQKAAPSTRKPISVGAQAQGKIAKQIIHAADYHPEQKDFTVHPASP